MATALKWLTILGKYAEIIGAIVAAILSIIASLHSDGSFLSQTPGKLAVVSAFVAGSGHAITHHSPLSSSGTN